MTISICMGIFNGERYIEEQLLSILEQTMQPDEVILCDDCSTDRTSDIVRAFIEHNHLQDRWFYYINESRKGYPFNFYYAMSLCKGDIVFLADQDDIWHRDKIKKMTVCFESNDSIKAVCCKFDLIDEKGHAIKTIMKPTSSRQSQALIPISLDQVFYKCEWPGMVLAYKNAWLQTRNKLRSHRIPHDFVVCSFAAEEQGFFQLDEMLASHRRHNNNTGGEEHRLRRLLNKNRKLKEIEDYLQILHYFDREALLTTAEGQKSLKSKLVSMQDRRYALRTGSVWAVIKNAWKHRGVVRAVTVICDVAIVRQRG